MNTVQASQVEARLANHENARRIDHLKSILNRAVDPEALKKMMADFEFERSIFNTGAAATAQFSCFRIESIDGVPYILCPIPFLFDEKRNIEAGFAIDVDQDHFSVYAYLHNYSAKESLVLSKLPHCVHRAINLDANNYDSIRDDVKEMSNEVSAIFFINSLLADLTVEGGMPVEFFDDKLYLQLLNRIVGITDPRWISHAVIGKKFDQLMRQFKNLDSDDLFFENNKLRCFTNVAQFLFGVSDVVNGNCFARYVDPGIIKQHANMIQLYLGSIEFLQFLFDFQGFSQNHVKPLLELFALGKIQLPRSFLRAIFDYLGNRISNEEKVDEYIRLMTSTNIVPDDDIIQAIYEQLFARADISAMKRLHNITRTMPTDAWIESIRAMLPDMMGHDKWTPDRMANFIIEFGIVPGYDMMQVLCRDLFSRADISSMKRLREIYGKVPSSAWFDSIRGLIPKLLSHAEWTAERLVDFANEFGMHLDNEMMQAIYQELFTRADIASIRRLHEITGTWPGGAWLDSMLASLPELLSLNTWTAESLAFFMMEFGIRPGITQTLGLLLQVLKQGNHGITKYLVSLIDDQEVFHQLLEHGKFDEICMLSRLTGTHPDERMLVYVHDELIRQGKWTSSFEALLKFMNRYNIYIDSSQCLVHPTRKDIREEQRRLKACLKLKQQQDKAIDWYMKRCTIEMLGMHVKEGVKELFYYLARRPQEITIDA